MPKVSSQQVLSPEVKPAFTQFALIVVILLPVAAIIYAAVGEYEYELTPATLAITGLMYLLTMLGVTVGFHRLFTHRSFQASRPLKIALAVIGSMAIQGTVTDWVADHRRHHAYADSDLDPHSPWKYGSHPWAMLRGLGHAHLGWLFERDVTNPKRFAADILQDGDLQLVSRTFGIWCAISLLSPPLLVLLFTGRPSEAVACFIWAGLIRVFLTHHIAWSINSIGHTFGHREFATNDESRNVPILAIFSMGDSWHNNHHAMPSSARHGLFKGQLDPAAKLIELLEMTSWASHVNRPSAAQIESLRHKLMVHRKKPAPSVAE